MDYFKELDLPAARRLEKEGTSVENGAQTVYRALTNPAFASILTATPPTVHGVKNNNFGQSIRVQGLPDIASHYPLWFHACKTLFQRRVAYPNCFSSHNLNLWLR